jgi:hypothetical protein
MGVEIIGSLWVEGNVGIIFTPRFLNSFCI